MTDRPDFVLSLETRQIADFIELTSPGEMFTYAALSKHIGRPIDGGDPVLQRAMQHLEKKGICFVNARAVGYRRQTDNGLVLETSRNRRLLQRRAKRYGRRLTKVENFEALSNEEKVTHQAHLSLFGAISSMASKTGIQRIERISTASSQKLALGKTLEAFK